MPPARIVRTADGARALLFSSGYLANLAVVTALVGREDAVFADRLNHASLNDAALLSRATLVRYPHADLDTLARQLAATRARRRLIATDAVFSMDGDIAPVPELAALAERHDAWLLVDDAHGFGILGPEGRGTLAHFNVRSPRVILMATLGKAAGVGGAFVAGEAEVIEWLVQRARPYVYTTATPPLLSVALLKSLDLIRHNEETLQVSARLAQEGLLVPAIRPPTVPRGTARLRISLSAAHAAGDVERLANALNALQ